MQEFDQETLAQHDGKGGGESVYIAYNGKVYDVSASKLWKKGAHMKRHQAGADLTAELPAAPHGLEVFERFEQVGILPEGEKAGKAKEPPAWLTALFRRYPMLKRHPHPMLVHYPIVFMFAAPLFTLLALLTGNRSFETTAFHCLGAGLLFTPFTIGSGLLTWWVNYEARPLRPVLIKLWGSVALLIVMALLFTWRLLDPAIATTGGTPGTIYLLLLLSLIPLVSVIGWYGAHLTFPTSMKK